jgi:hypothetical protein
VQRDVKEVLAEVLGKLTGKLNAPAVWVKAALDQWTAAARVTEGRIFRAVARWAKVKAAKKSA